MNFIKQYSQKLLGSIHGLDRIRFQGTIRWLSSDRGMNTFLSSTNILLKDFGKWADSITSDIRSSCEEQADKLGVEKRYLTSSAVNKEELARKIAVENGIKNGSICMFSVVEPCISPIVKGNKKIKKLELKMLPRKCVHIYHYFDLPEIGFGHVRLQTWLPMKVQICLNGRHWLEKQLIKNNIDYIKNGNCFPWVADIDVAQKLMDEQLKTPWAELLNALTMYSCPALKNLFLQYFPSYYWSAHETEWATDMMFKSGEVLDKLFPVLIKHAMLVSDSPSVMRYFGSNNISSSGKIKGRPPKEIMSDCRRRHEGVRVKHWKNKNSIKMYNKSNNILRVETTINNTRDFKVFRSPDEDSSKPPSWQKMRKGVSDLHRRCEVSDKCNTNYADSLSVVQLTETLKEVTEAACNYVRKNGKRFRALNPWNNEDFKLLTFLGNGELAINGFRNKDLCRWLYPKSDNISEKEKKRLTGRTTRRIRLLRAHGLIRKAPRVNRYVLTEKGRNFSVAILTASNVNSEELMDMAA